MTFSCRLTSPMLRPIHTVGHQLQSGRIHQMDHPFEAEGKPATTAASKTRTELLQVLQGLPKQFLSHDRVTLAIGIGKRVALGRSGSTNRRERSRVKRQGVTNIVEAQTMSHLREEQGQHMTPRCISPRVIRHTSFPCQLRNQMIRNEVADLTKDREATFRWLLFLAFCFHNRALWHGAEQKPTFFLSKTPLGYGMAVNSAGRRTSCCSVTLPASGESSMLPATFISLSVNRETHSGDTRWPCACLRR